MKIQILSIILLSFSSSSTTILTHTVTKTVHEIQEKTTIQNNRTNKKESKTAAAELVDLFVEAPNKDRITKITKQNKKRKQIFSIIRTGALLSGIGFIAWKLLKKKETTKTQINKEEQITMLNKRIESLEQLVGQSTSVKPQPNWLFTKAKNLGNHAGELVIDGLVGALIVDAITGSITNAVASHIPLNELLTKKPSLDWLVQQKTHYQSNLTRCSSLLETFNSQPIEKHTLLCHYLWYHAQELVYDVEQIVGYLAVEEQEERSLARKAKYKLLQEMLLDTTHNLCKEINQLLKNTTINQKITAIKNELESISGLIEEIRIRTKKQNTLLPHLF